MSYDTELIKVEQNANPELYKINVGFGQELYYYTNHSSNINFQGNEYKARAIKRSGFQLEKSLKAVTVNISAPISTPFGIFIANNPIIRTDVSIYSAFLPSPENAYREIFRGVATSVDIQNFTLIARCASFNFVLNDKVPRLFYQSNCNHHIFDVNCGLVEDDYKITRTIGTVITQTQLEIELDGIPDHHFKGGTLRCGNDQRLITEQVGDNVTILVPMPSISVGATVTMLPGCSGSPSACYGYNNLEHGFMGFPYIPTRNVVIWGFR